MVSSRGVRRGVSGSPDTALEVTACPRASRGSSSSTCRVFHEVKTLSPRFSDSVGGGASRVMSSSLLSKVSKHSRQLFSADIFKAQSYSLAMCALLSADGGEGSDGFHEVIVGVHGVGSGEEVIPIGLGEHAAHDLHVALVVGRVNGVDLRHWVQCRGRPQRSLGLVSVSADSSISDRVAGGRVRPVVSCPDSINKELVLLAVGDNIRVDGGRRCSHDGRIASQVPNISSDISLRFNRSTLSSVKAKPHSASVTVSILGLDLGQSGHLSKVVAKHVSDYGRCHLDSDVIGRGGIE